MENIPFYRRGLDERYVYVVKLEKLYPITNSIVRENIGKWIEYGAMLLDQDTPENDENVAAYRLIKDQKKDERYYELNSFSTLSEMRILWEKYPSLRDACEAYALICKSNLTGSPDLHSENIMQRDDGTFVLSDPLWSAPSIYAQHDAANRAEYMDYDDDPEEPNEYNSLIGGKIIPKKRPKLPVNNYNNDMPF